MIKKIFGICFLFFAVSVVSVFAQQKTEILDAQARAMLLGRHKLALQWISLDQQTWKHFGAATITQKNKIYYLKGKQTRRDTTDFLTIDGTITSIDAKEFKFNGKIITQVSFINGGKPCTREGEMTFRITGKRKYWRLKEIENPCEGVADYVDIFFR